MSDIEKIKPVTAEEETDVGSNLPVYGSEDR